MYNLLLHGWKGFEREGRRKTQKLNRFCLIKSAVLIYVFLTYLRKRWSSGSPAEVKSPCSRIEIWAIWLITLSRSFYFSGLSWPLNHSDWIMAADEQLSSLKKGFTKFSLEQLNLNRVQVRTRILIRCIKILLTETPWPKDTFIPHFHGHSRIFGHASHFLISIPRLRLEKNTLVFPEVSEKF